MGALVRWSRRASHPPEAAAVAARPGLSNLLVFPTLTSPCLSSHEAVAGEGAVGARRNSITFLILHLISSSTRRIVDKLAGVYTTKSSACDCFCFISDWASFRLNQKSCLVCQKVQHGMLWQLKREPEDKSMAASHWCGPWTWLTFWILFVIVYQVSRPTAPGLC